MRYLGVKIDENLNWKDHVHDIATRLNRALLFKIRNYVSFNTLKSIYFAIFDPHINYTNLIWSKTLTPHLELSLYRKNPLELSIISPGIVNQVYYLKKVIY